MYLYIFILFNYEFKSHTTSNRCLRIPDRGFDDLDRRSGSATIDEALCPWLQRYLHTKYLILMK